MLLCLLFALATSPISFIQEDPPDPPDPPEGNCVGVRNDIPINGEDIPGWWEKSGDSTKPNPEDSEDEAEARACNDAMIKAAIDFLARMDDCEGVDIPPIPDLTTENEGSILAGGPLVDNLRSLHAGGNICAEGRDDSENIKAKASYPQDKAAEHIHVQGHPGINIYPGYLAIGSECEKNEEGDYEFPEGKIVELAITLAHEANHVENPAEAGASERDEEGASYQYEGQVILAILCCPDLTADEKGKLCDLLGEVNIWLMKFDFQTVDPGDKCNESEGLSSSSAAYDLNLLRALDLPYRGSFPQGKLLGRVVLDPFSRLISFDLNGFSDFTETLDFTANPQWGLTGFQPTAITFVPSTPGPMNLLVAGYDESSLEGMLVMVGLDLASTTSFSAVVVHRSGHFAFPIAIDIPHFSPSRVAVLDAAVSKELLAVRLVSGQVDILMDTISNPEIANCSFVSAWNEIVESGGSSYAMISVHSWSQSDRSETKITVYDEGLDGVFNGTF